MNKNKIMAFAFYGIVAIIIIIMVNSYLTEKTINNYKVESYIGEYDGKPHGIIIDVYDGTILYGTEEGNYIESESPVRTEVGTTIVYYKIIRQKYKAVTGSAEITITPIESKLVLSETNNSYVFPAAFTIDVIENESGGELTCETDNIQIATCSILDNKITVKSESITGEVKIVVKAISKNKIASTTYTALIEEGNNTFEANGYVGKYDGKPHGIIVTSEGSTIKYGIVEGTYNEDESPVRTEIGTTTVYYQITKQGYKTITGRENITIKEEEKNIVFPTGTCKVKNNANGIYEFDVTATNGTNISTVNYVINGKETGFLTIKNYKTNEKVITANAILKDREGNKSTISCAIDNINYASNLNIALTSNENTQLKTNAQITIVVTGSGFKKIIFPNGSETTSQNASYEVTQNGNYTFIIEDIYNNKTTKSITISKVDSTSPTGTCKVENNYGTYEFKITAQDDNGIENINYIINGKETGFLTTKTYTTEEKIETASIILKDVVGNKTSVSCSIDNTNAGGETTYTFKYVKKADIANKPYIKCSTYSASDRTILEANLEIEVKNAGYGTRAGVVAAARFLVGALDYKIPYQGPKKSTIDPNRILGRYNKKGLNIGNSKGWGCSVNGYTQGMDCTNFVQWAFTNGGVELKNIYSTSNTTSSKNAVNEIQVGDLMLTPCSGCTTGAAFQHVGIVIGIDSSKIYVAESTTGKTSAIIVSELDKNNMPASGKFSVVKLYKYASNGNVTKMWK